MSEPKNLEASIEIDASVERVWQAIATDEMSRWFALDVRVTPGPDGKIWFSWGPGIEWETPIQVWEPNKRLQGGESGATVDYFLEKQGNATILRIVQSGFSGENWEDQYDSAAGGWAYFLYNLRYYLEHHAGKPRHAIWVRWPIEIPRESAWPQLLGASGLNLQPSMAKPGEHCSFEIGDAKLTGELVQLREARNLACTVHELNDGLMFIESEGRRAPWTCGVWLSVYGERPDLDLWQARLEHMMSGLFPKPVEV